MAMDRWLNRCRMPQFRKPPFHPQCGSSRWLTGPAHNGKRVRHFLTLSSVMLFCIRRVVILEMINSERSFADGRLPEAASLS